MYLTQHLNFSYNNHSKVSFSGGTGNVGIGTDYPLNRLDVEGGMAVGVSFSGNNSAPTNGMIIEGNVGIGTSSPLSELTIHGGAGENDAAITFDIDGTDWHLGVDDTFVSTFRIGTESTVGSHTLLTIDPDGNIRPQGNLTVNPGILRVGSVQDEKLIVKVGGTSWEDPHFALEASGSNNKWDFTVGGSDRFFIGYNESSKIVFDTDGNVGIGALTPDYKLEVNGTAGKPDGGTWSNSSDIRLKDIIGQYQRGLKAIAGLRPITFYYKEDNPRGLPIHEEYIGFIAQEVEELFPEAVSEGEDGYLNFNMHSVNVAVINAIQELHAENEALKAENETLRNEIGKIKKAIGL